MNMKKKKSKIQFTLQPLPSGITLYNLRMHSTYGDSGVYYWMGYYIFVDKISKQVFIIPDYVIHRIEDVKKPDNDNNTNGIITMFDNVIDWLLWKLGFRLIY